ncbi:MAG: enoyl-CoA hydratase/isomerase family protein [Deltaproteobacteria bacterium]|nr:enoyl-CoA hydratase/isomerase family protein [Deltaproteobacteria bacterium]MBW2361112.1 enoyl-CoA hydratase/isomerase family protein [Deltaproteobacteria bacterium]
MSEDILIEHDAGIATVTLNRPERMNGLTDEIMATLPGHLRELANEPDVRCVVITGAGDRAFSAGADLGAGGPMPADRNADSAAAGPPARSGAEKLPLYHETPWLLHSMPKPTLAAINGAAAGAALGIAMACDLRIASESAVFATAFARIGLSGDFGGTYFMTQLLGPAKARELYLLGDRIDAQEALRIGLVQRVAPGDAFREQARALARRLADGPPLAYRYMKRNLNAAMREDLRTVLDMEEEGIDRTALSEDFFLAVDAFLNKEKPSFLGR